MSQWNTSFCNFKTAWRKGQQWSWSRWWRKGKTLPFLQLGNVLVSAFSADQQGRKKENRQHYKGKKMILNQKYKVKKPFKNYNELRIKKCNAQNWNVDEITDIVSLPRTNASFALDENLTKSCNMSSWKQQMTKCNRMDLKNVTRNVLDQKESALRVPITVTTLLRYAIKNDLGFVDVKKQYTFEKILLNLTMRVYPRSLAGLNLNPRAKEHNSQMGQIDTFLKRICNETYLKQTGWKIIRKQGTWPQPARSICKYKEGNNSLKDFKFF